MSINSCQLCLVDELRTASPSPLWTAISSPISPFGAVAFELQEAVSNTDLDTSQLGAVSSSRFLPIESSPSGQLAKPDAARTRNKLESKHKVHSEISGPVETSQNHRVSHMMDIRKRSVEPSGRCSRSMSSRSHHIAKHIVKTAKFRS